MLKKKGQSPRLGKPFNQSEVYLTIQTVRKFGKTDIFRAQWSKFMTDKDFKSLHIQNYGQNVTLLCYFT